MNTPKKLDPKEERRFVADVVNDIGRKVNEIISFLEEKFPQSDEPILGSGGAGVTGEKSGCGCTSPHAKSDEPKCCELCKDNCLSMGCLCHQERVCPCHKPHWESDYAAIWERYWGDEVGYREDEVRQDIFELIRTLVK